MIKQIVNEQPLPKLVRIKIEKRTSMRVTGVSIPSVGHYNLINF